MKCPYCGNEMEQGLLSSGGHLVDWLPEGTSMAPFIFQKSPGKRLIKLFGKGICAYNCTNCRKVIVEYEDDIPRKDWWR